MTLEVILILIILLLITAIVFLSMKLYQFSIIILNVEDALETSLDILNERYRSMFKILQQPVFFNSPEVRQVIQDIKESHEALLVIANILTKDMGAIEYNEESKEEDS